MSIKTILISQPEPTSENSPYSKLIRKYKLKIDYNLNKFMNFSFRPSNEFFFKISSALIPLSELILGNIGLDDKGLKLHRNGKL